MKKVNFFIFIIFGLLLLIKSNSSWAIFGADDFKIEKFCQPTIKSARQTIIYVDDQILIKNESQWAKDLLSKLLANLIPSEQVTLVKISSNSGETQEIWHACYPNYTSVELDKIKKENNSFFGSDPVKQLQNQQAFFRKQFSDALGKILNLNGREINQVKIDLKNQNKKQIIRAFSNDGARFDTSRGAIRLIIYSDMLENSDLGISINDQIDKFNSQSVNFKNATIYVYGSGVTISSQGIITDKVKNFWKKIFEESNGHLVSFGSNLTIPSSVPVKYEAYNIEVNIEENKDSREGEMRLFIDQDGHLQDSYISISNKVQSVIQDGNYLCNDSKCTITANTINSVVTKQGNNEIKLKGTSENLVGTLAIPNAKLPNGKNAIFEMIAKTNK